MRIRTLAAAAVLAFGVALAASAPASAHMHFGGGGHFGGGHFGHFGHWGHHGWGGFGLGVVDVGGVDDDCIRWRPSYDYDGDYVGRRPVNICE